MDIITESIFFGSSLSLAAYMIGLQVKQRFKKDIFNPIMIAIILVIAFLLILGIDYDTYTDSAKYISYLLTPTTICLALPLHRQLTLLKNNLPAIAVGITAGVLSSCSFIFLLTKLFTLSNEEYFTLLPKSITTAIGLPLSTEMGGIGDITVAVIILTGIFGNLVATLVIKLFRIKHPIAKGVAIGSSSHAIGTVKAIELGEIEGAMSSLSIAVSGVVTVVAIQFFAGLV